MNIHVDKTQENKSQAVAKDVAQKQSGGESAFLPLSIGMVDNRPEALAQRKLQDMANNSPRVSQLRALQDMANNSPQARQAVQLQAIAYNHSAQQQQTIQKKANRTGLPDNLKTGTVQRAFDPALNLNQADDLKGQLTRAGYIINKSVILMRWFNDENANNARVLGDIPRIAEAIIADYPAIISPPAAGADLVAAEDEPAAAEVEPKRQPELSRSELDSAIQDAHEAALEEVRHGGAAAAQVETGDRRRQEEGLRRMDAPMARAAGEAEMVANPLIINYVWLGDRELGALEKFNIYSWRALGHTVNIYALRFDGAEVNHEGLGIASGDANVIDLHTQFRADGSVTAEDSPKHILNDARSVLDVMYRAMGTVKNADERRDLIYNMVDITKSYIGGTQRGIVLDMKVGPSQHLPAYAESFSRNFISYSRGGKTGAEVENQSMGTMQESDDLRRIYATSFNANLKMNMEGRDGLLKKPTEKWFNAITGWHGRAFGKLRNRLDVATKSPTGEVLPERGQYEVSEPKMPGKGPFRVFKAAAEQTNQGGPGLTTVGDVRVLADEVLGRQLTGLEEGRRGFVEKAMQARREM